MMASSQRISLFCCLILSLTSLVLAGGSRDYGEECSVTGQIGNIFTSDKNDNKDACNTDKNLICTGTCSCQPGFVYEKIGILSWVTGGSCKISANLPCTKESTCVSYAVCGDGLLNTCKCVEGYYSKNGHCSNGGTQIVLNSIYVFGLIASYFILA